MSSSASAPTRRPKPDPSARTKLLGALLAGLVGGAIAVLLGARKSAPLIAWDVLATAFCGWIWYVVWGLDARATATHTRKEDPGREATDLVLVGAAVASLVAVGVVLFGASHADGDLKYEQAGLAVLSVVLSWTLVHTLFTLKYARLYYSDSVGGINFNEDDPPQYMDFAYLSFTLGMTFQVSDTNIETKAIRRTALRHAWISFPLGTVIIASTINLISGLAK